MTPITFDISGTIEEFDFSQQEAGNQSPFYSFLLAGVIATSNTGHQLYLINTSIGDSTIINYGAVQYNRFAKICIQRLNGTAGNHKTIKPYGVLLNDTTIYDGTPSSLRLTPVMALYKLQSTNFQIAVANGSTATFSIKVRKSVVGDGIAYNGNFPRLILRANPSAGSAYNSDIICATATAASAGAWETLSYTLPSAVTDNVGMEFYVDCDGTTGWINIDTITVI